MKIQIFTAILIGALSVSVLAGKEGGNTIVLPNGKPTYKEELCTRTYPNALEVLTSQEAVVYERLLQVLRDYHPIMGRDFEKSLGQSTASDRTLVCETTRDLSQLLGLPKDEGRKAIFIKNADRGLNYIVINSDFHHLSSELKASLLFYEQLHNSISEASYVKASLIADNTMKLIEGHVGVPKTTETLNAFQKRIKELQLGAQSETRPYMLRHEDREAIQQYLIQTTYSFYQRGDIVKLSSGKAGTVVGIFDDWLDIEVSRSFLPNLIEHENIRFVKLISSDKQEGLLRSLQMCANKAAKEKCTCNVAGQIICAGDIVRDALDRHSVVQNVFPASRSVRTTTSLVSVDGVRLL